MKQILRKRILPLLLAAVLICGIVLPAQTVKAVGLTASAPEAAVQAEQEDQNQEELESLPFVKVEGETPAFLAETEVEPSDELQQEPHALSEVVRVSIVLEGESTLDKGFSVVDVAENKAAMAYRDSLKETQAAVTAAIEQATSSKLDVQWNLTLAANIISANVPYGQLDTIRGVPGVRDVVLETRYEPAVVETDESADPNMATSGEQIGSAAAWANGYTGLGSRVGIIDTGIDNDHQSFSAAAYNYMLAYNAGKAGMDVDDYVASLNLLDAEKIASVRDQLNAADFTAEDFYLNRKIPFAYNYIDKDLDTTHDNDTAGEHGSHVAGITGANRYVITKDGTFANALTEVFVQGVAPDTQLLAMKVFGKGGGAYDSDYFAAVEDAIVLGCDAVNLSLGTAAPGFTYNSTYQALLDRLAETDLVMVTSASNSKYWAGNLTNGVPYLFGDDVNFQTAAAPGTNLNTLTVASVDNAGGTGHYLIVGESQVFYNETAYKNAPFTTLLGEREYVLIDGRGYQADWDAVADLLPGRIAICSRGDSSFSEKANLAVARGAVGVIIYNNQPGVIGMNLSDYTYSAPVVSITQADGAVLKAAAEAVNDEEGAPRAWTGTLTVAPDLGSTFYGNEYTTLSSFSSWGVPGDLVLKPEICAPGGSIYSVNGAVASGDAYETMSGTSMAAPQVSGMVAVVGQFLRENGLAEKAGMSPRQLAQALLMGTAVPMIEEGSGNYYAVLGQGAGLGNVGRAVTAKSVLLMGEDAGASHADGKIKAELGDDPERTGEYGFSFTVKNFSESEAAYTLAAELFTQDLFEYQGQLYVDTWTAALAADAVFTVNGEVFTPRAALDCDLDGDSDTDADDALVILNYTAGLLDEIDPKADLDGDGAVTTRDAHLLLAGMDTEAFVLQPGETAEVAVALRLTDETKAVLDLYYPNGAYVEGYVFLKPVESADGAQEDAEQSIPVLAYYGCWSDPSMFEKGSYTDYLYGSTELQYFRNQEINNLIVKYPGASAASWEIGNPYFIEETYPEGRAAVSLNTILSTYKASLIRPAAATAVLVTDDDGRILYLSNPSDEDFGAWYYTNQGTWQDLSKSYSIGRKVKTLGVEEGDKIHVSLVAVPEYYSENGSVTKEALTNLIETGTLGKGAFLTTDLVVDDTAPEVFDISKSLMTGDLVVTARDNRYIAALLVTSWDGKTVYAAGCPNQTEEGQAMQIALDLSEAGIGKSCVVHLADYAGNMSSYMIELNGETEDYSGRMFAFSHGAVEKNVFGFTLTTWAEINPDEVGITFGPRWATWFQQFIRYGMTYLQELDNSNYTVYPRITAAEYVGGYVYCAAEDGYLYIREAGNWGEYLKIGTWDDVIQPVIYDKYQDPDNGYRVGVLDFSFNYADGKLYAIAASDTDSSDIYTLDLGTGALELAFTVTAAVPEGKTINRSLGNLAIDKEGVFWSVNRPLDFNASSANPSLCYLYKWSAEDIVDGNVTAEPVNPEVQIADVDSWTNTSYTRVAGISSMTWDHDKGILYLAATTPESYYLTHKMMVVDPQTGLATNAGSSSPARAKGCLGNAFTGLYVVPSTLQSELPSPHSATRISLSRTECTLPLNTTFTLTEIVNPWNLVDKSVIWSSTDETIVTVDQSGKATTVGLGTASVICTSKVTPSVSAACTVTVTAEKPSIAFSGFVIGETSAWADLNTENLSDWTNFCDSNQRLISGTFANGKIYAHDGTYMYSIDAEDQTVTRLMQIAPQWLWSDAASCEKSNPGHPLIGICNYGTYIAMINPLEGSLDYFDYTSIFADDPIAAIVCYNYDASKNTSYYYLMTESGKLYQWYTNGTGSGYGEIGTTTLELNGVSAHSLNAYVSMEYDAQCDLLIVSTNANSGEDSVYLLNPATGDVTDLGPVAEGTALTTLYRYDRIKELTVQTSPAAKILFAGDSIQLSARVLPKGSSQDVTWTSSDESVVTVDATGRIFAVAPGTAEITATSVEVNDAGEYAAATTQVTVNALAQMDLSFKAQVTTDTGSFWATVNTADLSSFTQGARAKTKFTGAGAQKGKIYATNSNFTGSCNLYEVDPASGTETKGSGCSASYAMLDGAANPTNLVYLYNAQGLGVLKDYAAGTIGAFDLAGNGYNGLAAIAYAGKSGSNDQYYILKTDGTIYSVPMNADQTQIQMNVAGNVGYTFDSYQTLSMTYVNDGTNRGLVVADSSNAGLYWINLTGTLGIVKLGTLEGATNIAGLYTDAELNGTLQTPAAPASCHSEPVTDVTGVGIRNTQAENVDCHVASLLAMTGTASLTGSTVIYAQSANLADNGPAPANAPAGSANSSHCETSAHTGRGNLTYAKSGVGIRNTQAEKTDCRVASLLAMTGRAARPLAAGPAEPVIDAGLVTLTIPLDKDAANGKLALGYDAEVLTLTGCDALTEYAVINDAEAGILTFAWAAAADLPAGTELLKLTFAYDEAVGLDTVVTVTALERGEDVALEEDPLEIPIHADAPHEHAYGEPVWTWTEDLTAATATFTCECGDQQILDAEITEEITLEPTEQAEGEKTVTATVEFNGETYTDVKTLALDKLEHDCPCAAFTDMPEYGTVEHDAIDWAFTAEPQITNGTSDTTFSPEKAVNRGQAVTFLWRAAGCPEPKSSENPFTDVKEGKFYYTAVLWAVEQGITNGTSADKFSPNKTCSRGDILTFIYRFRGEPEVDTSVEVPFTDVKASGYYYKALVWALQNGIDAGTSETAWEPKAECTRVAIVTYLYRIFTGHGLIEP